jgi:energy-coupling factor transport system ATP-binding protein
LIEFKNISFHYQSGGNENGLKNINLKVNEGETILICGESGCGKTTLTRLINGLIPHYYDGNLEGEVLIEGENLLEQPLYKISEKVGSVFQNPRTQFYNVETTSEIVFGCENRALPVPEILDRLEKTKRKLHLNHLMDRSLFSLSGGEKQRIACACVDTTSPQIMVLDEPSSNLDMNTIDDLAQVISSWKKEKKTIVIAEHRLHFLVPMADRIIYMQKGEITKEYTREEFNRLSPNEIEKMGLRSLKPFDLKPETKLNENFNKISINNFRFSYKRRGDLQLDIPSLEIPKNEIIAIIGNNGAGKSTFARALCGLDKTTKGVLQLDGKSYSTKQRNKLSYMVMQDVNHQLFTESVLDEILLSMDNDESEDDNIQKAKQILNSLDLIDHQELHPMSLSGGQKQRVAIGSAIASNNKILILDEPTSGLDYRHMLEVGGNLQKLQQLGKSIFIITHDLELICKSCTYVLFIEKGKVSWHRPMDFEAMALLKDFFTEQAKISAVQ